MQTSIEHLDEGKVRLTITVPAEGVDRQIDAAYARIGAKLRIPGFRPGKAPRPVIDTHFGRDAVLADAQEDIVSESYGQAISVEGLRTYGQPDVGELDAVEPGADYTYTAEVRLRPELTLSGVEDFEITVPQRRSSDREIDAHIEHTRERFATLEVVERAVESGDFVLISFVGTVGGEEYEGNRVDRYMYELGRGMMPVEFDQAIIGTLPGGGAVAEFIIPEESAAKEHVGKAARFEIEVHEVKAKVLPPLDGEFAVSVGGFDSFEEYRDDVRSKLDSAKIAGHARRVETGALKALVARLEGEVPQEMIDGRAASMAREFFENLEGRGISLQQYVDATGLKPEQIQADLKIQAAERVREELALEALFRARGFELTGTDIDEAVSELVNGDAAEAASMRASLEGNGALPILREQIVHRRALSWLIDNVSVTEEDLS